MARKMLLALSVISHQSHRLGASSYRVFDEHGGSIGRGKNNDWVLDDPACQLSSRHASVHASDDCFVIEDTSSNGTGLNTREALLPRGQRVPIVDGDRLFLGEFEILVQVVEHVAPPAAERPVSQPVDVTPVGDATVIPGSAALPGTAAVPGSDAIAVSQRSSVSNVSNVSGIATRGVLDLLDARARLEDQLRIKRPMSSVASRVQGTDAGAAPVALGQAFDELLRHASAVMAGLQAAHFAQSQRDAFVRAYEERIRELEGATIFDRQ